MVQQPTPVLVQVVILIWVGVFFVYLFCDGAPTNTSTRTSSDFGSGACFFRVLFWRRVFFSLVYERIKYVQNLKAERWKNTSKGVFCELGVCTLRTLRHMMFQCWNGGTQFFRTKYAQETCWNI